MLRIRFSPDDLGRVRFALAPVPVLETVLMLFELHNRPGSRTPRNVGRPLDSPDPVWLRRYLDGERQPARSLDAACLTPVWSQVTTWFHHDVNRRLATVRDYGVGAVLNELHPETRFAGLRLESPYDYDREPDLRGEGLVLMPSAFWTGHPLLTSDPEQPSRHVLVYPADRRPVDTAGKAAALSALLGPTRAALLTALRLPRTTSGVANLLGISAATASHHTGALRAAGLISTQRRGHAVEHSLTPLGRALLVQPRQRSASPGPVPATIASEEFPQH